MQRSWILLAGAAAIIAGLSLAGPTAIAAGNDDPFKKVESSKADSAWSSAKKAIAVKDYGKAIPLLKKVVAKNPQNADAYNYLGYSHAREGRQKQALMYYKEALSLQPKHRGANEYVGELYLTMGDLANAEKHLAALDSICTFGCAEFDMLKKAVSDYKQNGKFRSRKGA